MNNHKVKEVMSKHVLSINSQMEFLDACSLFENLEIHHIPIVDSSGKLEGVFSTFDALKALLTYCKNNLDTGKINKDLKIENAMSSDIIYKLEEDDNLIEAVKLFDSHRIDSLLVFNQKNMSGIITTHDVLRLIAST